MKKDITKGLVNALGKNHISELSIAEHILVDMCQDSVNDIHHTDKLLHDPNLTRTIEIQGYKNTKRASKAQLRMFLKDLGVINKAKEKKKKSLNDYFKSVTEDDSKETKNKTTRAKKRSNGSDSSETWE